MFSVSMENIITDYKDLEKGMQLTQKEYEARKHSRDAPPILKDFLSSSEDRLKKLQADIKTAEASSLLSRPTKILKGESINCYLFLAFKGGGAYLRFSAIN